MTIPHVQTDAWNLINAQIEPVHFSLAKLLVSRAGKVKANRPEKATPAPRPATDSWPCSASRAATRQRRPPTVIKTIVRLPAGAESFTTSEGLQGEDALRIPAVRLWQHTKSRKLQYNFQIGKKPCSVRDWQIRHDVRSKVVDT